MYIYSKLFKTRLMPNCSNSTILVHKLFEMCDLKYKVQNAYVHSVSLSLYVYNRDIYKRRTNLKIYLVR